MGMLILVGVGRRLDFGLGMSIHWVLLRFG